MAFAGKDILIIHFESFSSCGVSLRPLSALLQPRVDVRNVGVCRWSALPIKILHGCHSGSGDRHCVP
jgi:hypothetical protein